MAGGSFADPEGPPPRPPSAFCRADLPARRPARLDPLFQQEDCTAFRVTPSLDCASPGMLTRNPSATPFGLALGAD